MHEQRPYNLNLTVAVHHLQVGTPVQKMSLGSFCASEEKQGYSSAYDCSEVCIIPPWDAEKPEEQLCKAMNPCPPTRKGQDRVCPRDGALPLPC